MAKETLVLAFSLFALTGCASDSQGQPAEPTQGRLPEQGEEKPVDRQDGLHLSLAAASTVGAVDPTDGIRVILRNESTNTIQVRKPVGGTAFVYWRKMGSSVWPQRPPGSFMGAPLVSIPPGEQREALFPKPTDPGMYECYCEYASRAEPDVNWHGKLKSKILRIAVEHPESTRRY